MNEIDQPEKQESIIQQTLPENTVESFPADNKVSDGSVGVINGVFMSPNLPQTPENLKWLNEKIGQMRRGQY